MERTYTLNSQNQEKFCISIEEMAQRCGVGRSTAYEWSRTEGFPVIRIGKKRLLVPIAALERWLEAQAGGQSNDRPS